MLLYRLQGSMHRILYLPNVVEKVFTASCIYKPSHDLGKGVREKS